jgi:FkbM family methyltransferase
MVCVVIRGEAKKTTVKRSLKRGLFIFIAETIRRLPRIRGKVRLGLAAYRIANPANAEFIVEAEMFPERLHFVLNLTSAHERMAYLMNAFEPPTTPILEALWSNGAVLDVGANVGLIAVHLAYRLKRRSPEARVYAIEAMPSNFAALQKNIALNDLHSIIQPLCLGAGSEKKEVLIQIEGNDESRTGTANILPAEFGASIKLNVIPIDELLDRGVIAGHVSVMKIDTDGYDLEVLRGATKLLTSHRPAILVELNPVCLAWHGQTLSNVVEFASRLNYEVWLPERFGSSTFHRYSAGEKNAGDCLLLPSENAEELNQRVIEGTESRAG